MVVFRQQWPSPGTGLMSLLLTGGGCSTSLGGRVRQTGSPAALIRIPVIPNNNNNNNPAEWAFTCGSAERADINSKDRSNSNYLPALGARGWSRSGSSQEQLAPCEENKPAIKTMSLAQPSSHLPLQPRFAGSGSARRLSAPYVQHSQAG